MHLAKRCLERKIPYLGICRGSQILNVACGGSLYQDVERELARMEAGVAIKHMNYADYDGHRHPINVIAGTPLQDWFRDSLEGSGSMELNVNSYHHQGVKRLATRFRPMAFSPCGLIEAFYDPDVYNPEQGKFTVGLQFHPERMRHDRDSDRTDISSTASAASAESAFDYPGCAKAYKDFARAVVAYYQKTLLSSGSRSAHERNVRVKLDGAMEKQRLKIVRSFSIAKNIYDEKQTYIKRNRSMPHVLHALEAAMVSQTNDAIEHLEPGALFLQSTKVLNSFEREKRLTRAEATVRNSGVFFDRLRLQKDTDKKARMMLERLGTRELHDLHEFYKMMAESASEILEGRIVLMECL